MGVRSISYLLYLFTNIIDNLAVLITGGLVTDQSAEIYHPDRDTPCVLTALPRQRYVHTQDGELMCGGGWTWRTRSCRRGKADTGDWNLVTDSLTEERREHTSWTPADGSVTYLMGGLWSDQTSEAIDKDNGVTSSFPMQHRTA